MNVCTAITGSGTRCRGVAIDSSGLCHAHHPDRAEARSRAASKGGKRGGRGRPVAELATLRDDNADIRRRLLSDDLAPNVASVAVQSLNADARLIATALKAREMEDFEARLEELESFYEQQRASQGGGRW